VAEDTDDVIVVTTADLIQTLRTTDFDNAGPKIEMTTHILFHAAAGVLEKQQAEIENLEAQNHELRRGVAERDVEISGLQAMLSAYEARNDRGIEVPAQLETWTAAQTGSAEALLDELWELGFSWVNVAHMVGVGAPTVARWRRGESPSQQELQGLARIVALCALVQQEFGIEHPAAWLETPVLPDMLVTPMKMYIAGRVDLTLRFAADPKSVNQLLDEFEPEWRTWYHDDYEVHIDGDGVPALQERC